MRSIRIGPSALVVARLARHGAFRLRYGGRFSETSPTAAPLPLLPSCRDAIPHAAAARGSSP